MKRKRNTVAGAVVVAAALAGSAFGASRGGDATPVPGAVAAPAAGIAARPSSSTEDQIANLEAHLQRVPGDYPAWAGLGLAYVQLAKLTADSGQYANAQRSLEKSLSINSADNFLAYAGLSSLASGKHDFINGEVFARKGLLVNDSSPVLYGALTDALLQLGRYTEAGEATAKMLSLRPDTSSYARMSYFHELHGEVDLARSFMKKALDVAPSASDKTFALYFLGELDFNSGNVNGALEYYRRALAVSPGDGPALVGKAKALAALGQQQTAFDHFTAATEQASEPGALFQFGEFLQSIGRADEARTYFERGEKLQKGFEADGVGPDPSLVLYYADHGQAATALAYAEPAVKARPFLILQDAYAWALYANGRYEEALAASQKAMQLGERSALYHYHAGMIHLALGNRDDARRYLTTALDINPHFNALGAPKARAALASLG